jgi:hypothetical protein
VDDANVVIQIYAGVQTMGKAQGMEKVKKQFEEVEQWQKDLR